MIDVRDTILYPAAMAQNEAGSNAEQLGQATVRLLGDIEKLIERERTRYHMMATTGRAYKALCEQCPLNDSH